MDERRTHVKVPAPTPWPVTLALGVTLTFAGVVTHALVAAAGVVLMLVSAVGWWREVLPEEKHVALPVVPAKHGAQAVKPSARTVEHLKVGEKGHRVRVPLQRHPYLAGLRGGLVASVAMAAVAELYGLLAHGSVWFPVNALSAVIVPSLSDAGLAELEAFSALGLGLGIVIHITMSLFVGLMFACLLPMLPGRPILWGGVVTPLLWTALIWGTLGLINPTLDAHISWPWFFVSQVAFGVVCGRIISRSQPIETMQSWSLAARAGVEAAGVMDEEEADS